ncbi:hypothetical protein [Bacillus weihaiensis]|uniref:hypothetical protein n=1 Tax=Bacillus weihaiensis TaxID=1547283 RepID=UPI0023567D5D|nr:hypothetical protein [Bacillus weihaiensis]
MIDERFTVVDGIIGEVLASREFTKRFHNEIHILNKQLKGIDDPELKQHYVETYGIERKIEEKMKHNPIAYEGNRLLNLLLNNKIVSSWGASYSKDDVYIVCEFHARLQNGSQLSEKVKIREVNCEGFYSGVLIEDIAQMLLFREIAKQHGLN